MDIWLRSYARAAGVELAADRAIVADKRPRRPSMVAKGPRRAGSAVALGAVWLAGHAVAYGDRVIDPLIHHHNNV